MAPVKPMALTPCADTRRPPARPARFFGRALLLALPLALGLGLAAALPSPAAAEPNSYEILQDKAEAKEAFLSILKMWKGEMFFELYDEGWADSRGRISKEDFAQRMVALPWTPEENPDAKTFTADFRFRTMVYIKARVTYHSKFASGDTITLDQEFMLLKEEGKWKVDLIKLLRSPYY